MWINGVDDDPIICVPIVSVALRIRCDSEHGHSARQVRKLLGPLCQRLCGEEFHCQSETLPGSLYL
jgi:hypothetical protein